MGRTWCGCPWSKLTVYGVDIRGCQSTPESPRSHRDEWVEHKKELVKVPEDLREKEEEPESLPPNQNEEYPVTLVPVLVQVVHLPGVLLLFVLLLVHLEGTPGLPDPLVPPSPVGVTPGKTQYRKGSVDQINTVPKFIGIGSLLPSLQGGYLSLYMTGRLLLLDVCRPDTGWTPPSVLQGGLSPVRHGCLPLIR